MTRLLVLSAFVMATAAVSAQQPAGDSPVHATLRLAGERNSFKNGEPVRLELVLTADKPGFIVDIDGIDNASDELSINPAEGVHRLDTFGWRDTILPQPLSEKPTVLSLALNYWVRFERAGTFTISFQTRRVSAAGPDGRYAGSNWLNVRTNAVTFRIEPTSLDDEQELIATAGRNLQSTLALGDGDRAFTEKIRAAEELAFLPGDAAAIEKYRWYKELGSHLSFGNARGLLWRGFGMTRNPSVLLAEVEADLQDLNQAVTWETINNAASLSVAIKYPGLRQNHAVPLPPGGTDPMSVERSRYLNIVHESLDRRSGLVRLLSAGAMLDSMSNTTPRDVVRIIIDGFEQFPVGSRVGLASARWQTIRDVRLGPALRRTLEEVEPGSRSYIFPALIDVAPSLAVEPLSFDILDPKRIISADIVRKMPRASLSHLAPKLVATIRKMSTEFPGDAFRIERKIELLGIVGDGAVRKDVVMIYDSLPEPAPYGTRESLLRYLLEWDPEEGARRVKEAAVSGDAGSLLYKIASDGPPLPALTSLLRERLFDRDLTAAELAAGLLAKEAGTEDREAIDLRLLQWRLDRQQRLANGELLTDADGSFESGMVRALAQALRISEAGPERDRLVAACLTEACKATFRER